MNSKRLLLSGLLSLAAAMFVNAQAPAAQPTAAKIGIVQSDRFSDPNGGIARLVKALKTLENEFVPKRQQIAGMVTRLETLTREINAAPTSPATAGKIEQARTLEVDIKRQQEDGRVAYAKRHAALTDPIRRSISDALGLFAKQRGIDVLIDGSKFPEGIYLVNPASDMTQAFIRDFNAKNP